MKICLATSQHALVRLKHATSGQWKQSEAALSQDCYLHRVFYILDLKTISGLNLLSFLIKCPVGFQRTKSITFVSCDRFHSAGLTFCLSAPLPTVSTHVSLSIIHCPSFPLRPLYFTICPFCDLGACGRQGDGLQAALEIGSRPAHGRADQLISPRSQRLCKKSGRE